MKNLKCAVGATILTPLIVAGIISLFVGLMWLMVNFGLFKIIILILAAGVCTIFVIMIWYAIYEHCVKKHIGEN